MGHAQFNSGKSTLINAIVGREVAATDVFEMTHAACTLVPGEAGTDNVELHSNQNGLAILYLSLNDFLARCRRRDLGSYTQAIVTLPLPFDLMLIDTPGMGATLAHEREATDMLAISDIVLYVLDASSLGGAPDGAFLRRMDEIGMPFVCILNKVDLLADDEHKIALDYIVDRSKVPTEQVFCVSARPTLELRNDGEIKRLIEFLRTSVSARGAALRAHARHSIAIDIASEAMGCISAVAVSVSAAADEANTYRTSLLQMSKAVTTDICHAVEDVVRARLILAVESPLYSRMQASQTIDQAEFEAAIRDALRDVVSDEFLQALSSQVEQRFQNEWAEGLRGNIQILQQQLTELREAADQGASAVIEEMLANERQKQQVVTEAVNVVAIGLNAALFLVNPFMALAGVGATMLYSRYRDQRVKRERSEMEQQTRDTIQEWRDAMIKQFVWGTFYGKLLEQNNKVADEAARQYALGRPAWPVTLIELRELQQECRQLTIQLAAVCNSHESPNGHNYGPTFSNYPYTFGLLFGLRLYSKYLKAPDNSWHSSLAVIL